MFGVPSISNAHIYESDPKASFLRLICIFFLIRGIFVVSEFEEYFTRPQRGVFCLCNGVDLEIGSR